MADRDPTKDPAAKDPDVAALFRLADLHGVQTRYRDFRGSWRSASPEAVRAVLGAMGVEAGDPKAVRQSERAKRTARERRLVDPLTVVWLDGDEPPGVPLRLPSSAPDRTVSCLLRLDDGTEHAWEAEPRPRIPFPLPVPAGYHELEVSARGRTGRTTILAAPRRTWRPTTDADYADDEERAREWGVFLPLYALRSDRSWGTGDLRDLERLLSWTERLGGRVVGTTPLLAGAERSPDDARVYSPVSRLFWNEVYLDVERAPELERSAEARALLESGEHRERIRRLRERDTVDWQGAVEARRAVLEPLARDVFDGGPPRGLRRFVRTRPEAVEYARFRAVWEDRGEPWAAWPRALRDGRLGPPADDAPLDPGRGDASAFRRHLYAQWLADRQMRRLRDERAEAGAGLYLDLPVGADPDGYDVWSRRDLFPRGVSVGSPPDAFFSEGQDWGFPPPDPGIMRRSGLAYTVACLRHHMRVSSRLRLDHVMGLHRLFWVPEDLPAREGVYVRYPHEALYAALCIESHRTRTAVVGEDLGTVPPEVREEMERRGVARMYVAQFEAGTDEPALPPPPAGSVASLNTHDTATFAGFWRGADVDVRSELGLLDDEDLADERRERDELRRAWVRFLQQKRAVPRATDADDPGAALRGSLRHLAGSRAGLVLVNLEDLWLEERPQNVPGTGRERPNFRRKASLDLETVVESEAVADVLRELDRLRRGPGEDEPTGTAGTESRAAPPRGGARSGAADGAPAGDGEAASATGAAAKDESDPTDDANPTNEETMAIQTTAPPDVRDVSPLTDDDLHLFNEGSHFHLYEKLGSRLVRHEGVAGAHFAVWAPNAREVRVIGDFNEWDREADPLEPRGESGIWEGFVPGVEKGQRYKYHIRSSREDYRVDKADPFAVRHETPPDTASVVWDLDYEWGDDEWMRERGDRLAADAPVSVYELHVGSWRRRDDGRPPTYREMAPELVEYLRETGFTHVELLPVMEHPFYGSWGYQTTGYFAPTSRYGTPQDFMYLVDRLHRAGFGVILDWVPSHFPNDEHGLAYFDGTHLFEHADPREGFHPDWKSHIFNYGRHEVRSFLISSALFWLDRFHADGLRVDAVASMLYRDYGRKDGEWIPNEHGGRENLEAIDFLRRLNEEVYRRHPDTQTIAEESTAWPMVSRPTYVGGLGFGMKWDMGWMHDTLEYMTNDPVHRQYHHDQLTFRRIYAFSENFVLPLSHDEVVHGKRSLLEKMPGDDWQKFANLRLLLAYQIAQPAKKLLFMGGEIGQRREWTHEGQLDWHLLDRPAHEGVRRWTADLNRTYRSEPALHERDFEEEGFEWIDANDSDQSTLSFLRKGRSDDERVAAVFNFTPVPRENFRLGVPRGGRWEELLNSDAELYGGSGRGNLGSVEATPVPYHGRPHSLVLSLPPLSALFLKAPPEGRSVRPSGDGRDGGPEEERR